jgi:hypothetical protein
VATMHFTDPWGRARSGAMQVVTDNAAHTAVVIAATQ